MIEHDHFLLVERKITLDKLNTHCYLESTVSQPNLKGKTWTKNIALDVMMIFTTGIMNLVFPNAGCWKRPSVLNVKESTSTKDRLGNKNRKCCQIALAKANLSSLTQILILNQNLKGIEMNQYEENIKYLIDAILDRQSRLDTPLEIEVDLRRMSAAEISDMKKYFVDSYNA